MVRYQAKCFYDNPLTKVLFIVLSIQRPHSNFPARMRCLPRHWQICSCSV